MLRKCPQHGLPKWMQIQTLYVGLSISSQTLVNVAASGALIRKADDAAFDLLEELALNNDHGPAE